MTDSSAAAHPSAAPPQMQLVTGRHDQAVADLTSRHLAARLPRLIATTFRLAWTADPRALVTLLACQLGAALCAAFGLAATTSALTGLLATTPTTDRLRDTAPGLLALIAALIVRSLLTSGAVAVQARLAPRLGRVAEVRVIEAATAVEAIAYESPGFEDALDAADTGAANVRNLLADTVDLTAAALTLTATAGVLGLLHPALVPLLLLAAAPRGWAAIRTARITHTTAHATRSDTRLRNTLRSYITARTTAPEVRTATMRPFLIGQYEQVAERLEHQAVRLAVASLRVRMTGDAIAGLLTGATWAALVWLAASGRVSLAAAGAAVVGIRVASAAVDSMVRAAAKVFHTGLYVDDWRTFLADAEQWRTTRGTTALPTAGPALVRAEAVSFTYPGRDTPAVADLSLELRQGEVVALVGENGCGKTTLVKLLLGLYLPDTGTVTWDGVNTADTDPEQLWAHVASVPQDYTRWPMNARNNIDLGQPAPRGDRAVHEAAEAAGADTAVAALPDGLDTSLARSWWGGHDLSGGQWQRIAIARAFHRDGALLVLDEPTAALDARAEHHVFTRLRALAAGRTTVFVTHRLANVRTADRIIVMNTGRIVETGTFDELAHAGGLFNELYKLQQG
ncbi:ATP-binding cassette domain-containing protein [Embleya sp. NPDC127516]|uniref:ATP-binding cassette domain-containing protein n=1 Tax=Embleya sp. NPDC127516 TaxID=3363990 RepID=UPI00380B706A